MSEENPKIAIVVTQLEAGGAQKAACNLANELKKKGYEVCLVFFYKLKEADLNLNKSITVNVLFEKRDKLNLLVKTPFVLRDFLLTNSIDAVVSFTHYANIYSSISCRMAGLPIVVSHRNPWHSYNVITKLVDFVLCKFSFYQHVVFVSYSVKKSFPIFYAKGTVIWNCVTIPKSDFHDSALSNEDYILSVGRLTKQKNHKLLVKALAEINSDLNLKIIGDGPLLNELVSLSKKLNISERVEFLGTMPNTEVLKYIANSNYYVMPSLYEGMSNSLIEAIVLGAITVVSDVSSQVEAVTYRDQLYGYVLPVDNLENWISFFDRNKSIASSNEPSKSVHKNLIKRYSSVRFGNEFEAVIKSIL